MTSLTHASTSSRFSRTLYGFFLGLIAVTGFAQMPIFKRYYIADIPGLGWLAQFEVTHLIHYGLAAVFLALCTQWGLTYFLEGRKPMAKAALFRGITMAILCVTGGLMVWKNFPEVYFSHALIHVLDLVHMAAAMVLVALSVLSVFGRKA